MNKFLSLSVIPLAATATVASVMMASAPAQALVLGTIQVTGDAAYVNDPSDINDVLDMSGFNIAFSGSGVLAGLNGLTAAPLADINLGNVNGVSGIYSSTVTNPLVTFADTTTFSLKTPFNVQMVFLPGGGFGAGIEPFVGTFSGPGYSGPARGVFTAQKLSAAGGSYSMTIEAVPEPLTILGTGLALGFGGLFKSKSSKKQSVKA
jgi:hypothetical protein